MRRVATLFLVVGLLGLIPAGAASAGTTHAALRRTLPEVKFDGVALTDAIDFVRDVGGVNIDVNWKALAEAGITRNTPITVRLHGVNIQRILDTLLGEAAGGDALTFYLDQGVIEVTTRAIADAKMYVRVYPVEDLILDVPNFDNAPDFNLQGTSSSNSGSGGQNGGNNGGGAGQGLFSPNAAKKETVKTKDQRAQDLIDTITSTVRPEIWKVNGGTASIHYFNGQLVVSAPRSVQEMIGGPLPD